MPLTPTLSPLVPRGEREKTSPGCITMRPRSVGAPNSSSASDSASAALNRAELEFRGPVYAPAPRLGQSHFHRGRLWNHFVMRIHCDAAADRVPGGCTQAGKLLSQYCSLAQTKLHRLPSS